MNRRGWLGNGIEKIGELTQKVTKAQATADKAEATGQNARQMVLNRDVTLKDLQADAATIPDIINAAATEHARMTEEFEARIAGIELTPGPAGRDGADGARGPAGADGVDGRPGRDGTDGAQGAPGNDGKPGRDGIDGAPGKDGRNGVDGAPGTNGRDGLNGTNGKDGVPGKSAYDIAVAAGYTGTQTEWLSSLRGKDATPGAVQQIEYRDGIPVPAVLSLLGLSADSAPITVTWATPFPDDTYTVTQPQTTAVTASVIGRTQARVTAKTRTGCTIVVTTTAVLAAGNATLSVLAYRKA